MAHGSLKLFTLHSYMHSNMHVKVSIKNWIIINKHYGLLMHPHFFLLILIYYDQFFLSIAFWKV